MTREIGKQDIIDQLELLRKYKVNYFKYKDKINKADTDIDDVAVFGNQARDVKDRYKQQIEEGRKLLKTLKTQIEQLEESIFNAVDAYNSDINTMDDDKISLNHDDISRQSPIFCNLQFKYVPEPMVLDDLGNRVVGKFDHLYTDYELFNTWNISSEMCENICKIVKDYNDLVQQVYKENAIRIFVKAKGVGENLNKIKEIQQKYKERTYDNSQEDLEIVTDLQDLDQCKGLIDNQISLIDSVQFQIEKLLYYFSSYYTVENSWDAGKPIQIVLSDGQQKIVHADSIMQEIMTVHRNFLNKQGWSYVKQKILEYGLCNSKQLELIDFMYSLLEILTMVQFDNQCLEILGKSEISCENIRFGKTRYNIIR